MSLRPEKKLERLVQEAAAAAGISRWKLHGSLFQPGLPDDMLVGERIVLAELKVTRQEDPFNCLRGSQAGFFAQARRCGSVFLLAADPGLREGRLLRADGRMEARGPLEEVLACLAQATR
jgi:hypothetical protein